MKFAAAFAGQVVCVAGAGGYIGSTLVKALAQAGPRSLILLDTSEFGLFEIERWVEAAYPAVPCECILGSVEDDGLLDEVFARLRPQAVFHAAAFKHVGLLERNPFAAVRNNALASYSLARTAARHGVLKFVLISSDKAVNPHSVMGLSKRIAELFTLCVPGTNVIRLGNVIGSTGSVIPLLLEQIEKAQPVLVTHPEASRYFLSRDEAATSILAAGAAGCSGMVLLPKCAEPVRIVDLARFLIGSRAIPIRFTGLKPGEKLTEEWIGDGETQIGTVDGPLAVLQTRRLLRGQAEEAVRRLATCAEERDGGALLDVLCALVPEYVPSRLMQQYAVAV
jgi:FlaA1/EpsC-like NDP-sugar epimerase